VYAQQSSGAAYAAQTVSFATPAAAASFAAFARRGCAVLDDLGPGGSGGGFFAESEEHGEERANSSHVAEELLGDVAGLRFYKQRRDFRARLAPRGGSLGEALHESTQQPRTTSTGEV